MTAGPAGAAPALARRMASFLYEGVLLFGLVMAVALVYGVATGQRHALVGTLGLRVALFSSLAAYFIFFWARHGQTLAMKTWRIRLVTASGGGLGWFRAGARFLLSWLWFLPALLALAISGLHDGTQAFVTLSVGVLAYAGLALLRRDRQFWHDIACGTRLVQWDSPRAP